MKNSFVLYTSYQEQIDLLTMEQRGRLLTAILAYAAGETPSDMDDVTRMAFSFIRSDMDKNEEKYQKTVEARREAGKKGGRPKANASEEKQKKQMVFSKTKGNQKNPEYVDVYEDDKEIKEKEVKEKRFTPPTPQDVRQYAESQGYSIDADRFVDFYESKGWMVGKNKMKDWHAAVRGWASREKQNTSAKGKYVNFNPSGENWDDLAYQVMNH